MVLLPIVIVLAVLVLALIWALWTSDKKHKAVEAENKSIRGLVAKYEAIRQERELHPDASAPGLTIWEQRLLLSVHGLIQAQLTGKDGGPAVVQNAEASALDSARPGGPAPAPEAPAKAPAGPAKAPPPPIDFDAPPPDAVKTAPAKTPRTPRIRVTKPKAAHKTAGAGK